MATNIEKVIQGLQGPSRELHDLIYGNLFNDDASGLTDKVKSLIEKNAIPWNLPPGSKNELGQIDFAMNHPEVVMLLLTAKAVPTDCSLGLALRSKHPRREEVIRSLISARAPLDEPPARHINSALEFEHNLEIIRLLVQEGAVVPEVFASDKPMQEGVREFLSAKAAEKARQNASSAETPRFFSIDLTSSDNRSTVLFATVGEELSELRKLWETTLENEKGSGVERLIKEGKVFNANDGKLSALDIAVSFEMDIRFIHRLLDCGAKVEKPNSLAIFFLNYDKAPKELVTRLLNEGGARKDVGHRGVLGTAVGRQSKEVIEMLIEAGAKANMDFEHISNEQLGVDGQDAAELRAKLKATMPPVPQSSVADSIEDPEPSRAENAWWKNNDMHVRAWLAHGLQERLDATVQNNAPPASPLPLRRFCACFDGILPQFVVNILEGICGGVASFISWVRRSL
ncbi:MAG: hypothetical protein ACHQT8_01815 [Chlamydiales bacterium]